MAPSTSALALSCALAVPAAGFVGPSAPGSASPPSLRSGSASTAQGDARTWGLATIACSSVAVAGVVAASSRRRSTAMRAAPIAERQMKKPQSEATKPENRYGWLVWQWQVNPVRPALDGDSYASFQKMVGADVETNNEPWDPMGFARLYDRNYDFNNVMVYPHVHWLREAELKHGRIAMLAFVGNVAQQFLHIPGYPICPDWTQAFEVCRADPTGVFGIGQIFGAIGLIEGPGLRGLSWIGKADNEPGDYGFDPLKFSRKPGFDLKKKQLAELKNGRLAMIGWASMVANHFVPGSVPLLDGSYAVHPDSNKGKAASMGFCGKSASKTEVSSKTAARYTTQVILPSLTWIKTGLKVGELQPTELRARTLAGVDVLIGKDGSGNLFCVGNLCPHIGTPMSEGADVIGDVIVCPLHGSSFKVSTGELIDWCVSPPIIGPLTGLIIEKKNLAVFDVRTSFFGGDIEVLVDTNAKKAYEADYWRGLLDAQGKDDGTYY